MKNQLQALWHFLGNLLVILGFPLYIIIIVLTDDRSAVWLRLLIYTLIIMGGVTGFYFAFGPALNEVILFGWKFNPPVTVLLTSWLAGVVLGIVGILSEYFVKQWYPRLHTYVIGLIIIMIVFLTGSFFVSLFPWVRLMRN
ncbi:hypothetical protein HYV31_00865 [candidate division WWE3 bacterium]|nr:hypothetical protein [candidate division WWE3 bacterium]